ncbi:transposase [Candidatus Poriferisodalis sp.]|uniref:transposase n=1 Tax=Candidatus Poriferisodalis sp. TaxID=3101277 RepID=UPI003C6F7C19
MEAAALGTPEVLICEARWNGPVPACPHCGGMRLSVVAPDGSAWTKWRCAACRKRFTAATRTRMHATKLSPADWLRIVEIDTLFAATIAAAVSVSLVTARKIVALLAPVAECGRSERLQFLVAARSTRPASQDGWQRDQLSVILRAQDNPLRSLSAGAKATMNALRARPFGATAAKLAHLSGVSYAQTLRCLASLEERGFAAGSPETISWGNGTRKVTLWRLSWSEGCMRVLGYLREVPTRRPDDLEDRVPERYWHCFWSGAAAETLRISQHGLHIAETMIGGRDPCARAWALSNLPISVLRECRTVRGCDTGLTAEMIDAEITRRVAA